MKQTKTLTFNSTQDLDMWKIKFKTFLVLYHHLKADTDL